MLCYTVWQFSFHIFTVYSQNCPIQLCIGKDIKAQSINLHQISLFQANFIKLGAHYTLDKYRECLIPSRDTYPARPLLLVKPNWQFKFNLLYGVGGVTPYIHYYTVMPLYYTFILITWIFLCIRCEVAVLKVICRSCVPRFRCV